MWSLFLLLPSAVQAREYVKGPNGVLMGLLVDPESSGSGVVVHCNDNEVRAIQSRINVWQRKFKHVGDDEAKIGNAVKNLGAPYSKYPAPSAYLNDMSEAINGQNGLTAYLHGISDGLKESSQCIWSPKFLRGGCRTIPRDCFDEGRVQARGLQASRAIKALIENLEQNQARLVSGQPSGWIIKNKQRVFCDAQTPPCAQHLDGALDTINKAQSSISAQLD